jgi:hypothetical protein
LKKKTVVPSDRGDLYLCMAELTVRVVPSDPAGFKLGIKGDTTALRRMAERHGLKVRFKRVRSGPGYTAGCNAYFVPCTERWGEKPADRRELCIELLRRATDTTEGFLQLRPEAKPSRRHRQRPEESKRKRQKSQFQLAGLAATH